MISLCSFRLLEILSVETFLHFLFKTLAIVSKSASIYLFNVFPIISKNLSFDIFLDFKA